MLDGSVIQWFQQWSTPWLDQLFIVFTRLGQVYFYMIVIPLVYWCIDRRRGHTLAFLFLCSMWLNGLVKELIAWPRPNPGFEGIRRIAGAEGPGFPSGHAQGSLTMWGYLAARFGFARGGSRGFGWLALAAIVLVSLSRIYLGVHYPLDVLGGWTLGFAMLILFLVGESRGWGTGWSRRTKATLAVVLPLLAVPFYQGDLALMTLGLLMGFLLGDLYGLEHTPYRERVSPGRQLAKLGIGYAGFAVLYALHELFVPPGLPALFGFALLGLWVTVGAPALFVRWGLAGEPARTGKAPSVLPDVELPEPLAGEARYAAAPARPSRRSSSRRASNQKAPRVVLRITVTLVMLVAASSVLAAAIPPPSGPVSPIMPRAGVVSGAGAGGAAEDAAGVGDGAGSGAGAEAEGSDARRPAVIAHQGDAANFPGDTLPAFESAVAMGVDAVELDVHLTQDGRAVVMHDHRVDRTTNGAGRISDYRLEQLKLMDAGYRFTRDGGATYPWRGEGLEIPTLLEVLEALPDTTRYVIEMKDAKPALAERVVEVLDQTGARDRVLVASFHGEALRAFRDLAPDVATSLALQEGLAFVAMQRLGLWAFYRPPVRTAQFPPSEYGIPIVTPAAVEVAHDIGMDIDVWTIDNPVHMRRFVAMGVDGILTNDPATLKEVLERRRRGREE